MSRCPGGEQAGFHEMKRKNDTLSAYRACCIGCQISGPACITLSLSDVQKRNPRTIEREVELLEPHLQALYSAMLPNMQLILWQG